jgi:DUF177 domain-containing protein
VRVGGAEGAGFIFVFAKLFDRTPEPGYYPMFSFAGVASSTRRRARAGRMQHDGPEAPGGPRVPRFDAFRLAAQRGAIHGEVLASALPRVAETLADDEGKVAYTLTGTVDAADRPALEIEIEGALTLTCQRCLQPMTWPAEQRTLLLLARDERECVRLDENEEHEVLLASGPLDLLAVIEDELLLTMPFAPRHPPDEMARCRPATGADDADETAVPKRDSPFDALAGLKAARGPHKKG